MTPLRTLLVLILAAAPLAAQTSVVEGQVTNALTGKPVAGAAVTLRGMTRSGNPPRTDNYVTETDAQGHFLIQGMLPGRYSATPSGDGFVAGTVTSGASRPPLTLAAGQHATVALQLIPAAIIAGRTVDLDGDPLRGVAVEAVIYSSNSGQRRLMARGWAQSNDLGEFCISDLAPGSYYIRATAQQRPASFSPSEQIRGPRPPEGFAVTYYPSAGDASQTAPLEVAPGAELRNVEIRLHPQMLYSVRVKSPMTPGGMAPSVSLRPRAADTGMYRGWTTTRSNDWLEFMAVLPGSYELSATAPDPDRPGRQTYAREPVDVVDHDVELPELKFLPGAEVSGTVKVSGELPFPLATLRPMLVGNNGSTGSPAAAVNPDGGFAFHDVTPGTFELRMTVPRGAYLKALLRGDRDLSDQRIDVPGDSAAVTILLATDGGVVEGSVENSKGEPSKQSRVMLAPDGRLRDRADLVRAGGTNEEGKFTLRDIPPGDYRLFAWEDAEQGAPMDPEFRKPFEQQAAAVKVAPASRQTINLKTILTRQ